MHRSGMILMLSFSSFIAFAGQSWTQYKQWRHLRLFTSMP
jgi:hypothetical protein